MVAIIESCANQEKKTTTTGSLLQVEKESNV